MIPRSEPTANAAANVYSIYKYGNDQLAYSYLATLFFLALKPYVLRNRQRYPKAGTNPELMIIYAHNQFN